MALSSLSFWITLDFNTLINHHIFILSEDAPNDELLEGIERFVNLGISNDNQYLTDTYTVLGHCQLDKNDYFTECPGDGFYEEVIPQDLEELT